MMTGALEAMVVDYQCIMPSVTDVARCFHTQVISTSDKAKFPGAVHVPFDPAPRARDRAATSSAGRSRPIRTGTRTACASRTARSR